MTTANDNQEEGAVVIRDVHQSGSGDHDRLGFHCDCPVCQQDRLFDVLAPEPIWSRRLGVLLAAGVLAVSAGVTATSLASEPDDQQEGIVAPTPGTSPPVGDGPGQGSGVETALPFEVDPVPAAPDGGSTDGQPDEAAPLEAAPVDAPDGGLALSDPNAPAEDDGSAVDPGEVDASETPVPPAEPIPPGTPVPAAPGDPGDQLGPAEQAPAAKPKQHSRARREHRERHPAKKRARDHSRGQLRVASPPAAYTPSNDAQAATPAAVAPASRRIRGRFHVVLPGESLWSIASALLDAGASPAAVALEVRRLWRLNAARIGTGDPSLLRIGVRLRLR
jgi:hypothetical protein